MNIRELLADAEENIEVSQSVLDVPSGGTIPVVEAIPPNRERDDHKIVVAPGFGESLGQMKLVAKVLAQTTKMVVDSYEFSLHGREMNEPYRQIPTAMRDTHLAVEQHASRSNNARLTSVGHSMGFYSISMAAGHQPGVSHLIAWSGIGLTTPESEYRYYLAVRDKLEHGESDPRIDANVQQLVKTFVGKAGALAVWSGLKHADLRSVRYMIDAGRDYFLLPSRVRTAGKITLAHAYVADDLQKAKQAGVFQAWTHGENDPLFHRRHVPAEVSDLFNAHLLMEAPHEGHYPAGTTDALFQVYKYVAPLVRVIVDLDSM